MRKLIACLAALSMLFADFASQPSIAAEKALSLEYHLYLEKEDHPRAEIKVSGVTAGTLEFGFAEGGILGTIEDLTGIYTDVSVTSGGKSLRWEWKDKRSLRIQNSGAKECIISYNIDAQGIARTDASGDVNETHSGEQFMLFRNSAVFFSPAEVFIIPNQEPGEITFIPHFPEGLDLYSTLSETNGVYKAETDLWNNLSLDFSKSYFFGGKTILHEEMQGVSGNTYTYVLFDWRNQPNFYDPWFPSFPDKRTAAIAYMKVMDMFYQYYGEQIGPLPAHHVLITDPIPDGKNLPKVYSRGNWYNFMQLWPENSSLYQIAHHIYHSYSFMGLSAKLNVQSSERFLMEGLPAYYEFFATSTLFNDPTVMGRLYALLMLDQRGAGFGIRDNQYHQRYNEGPLKVYLLDETIKKATGGKKNINDFSRELWNLVKDSREPTELNSEDMEAAFIKTAGRENIELYRDISDLKEFDVKDFSGLYDSFLDYCDKMSKEYFWDSKLLFLCYMDVCASMGEHWPHYGLIEHNLVQEMRRSALERFKITLQNLGKKEFTKQDILDALSVSTGKDHSGFFEFWSGMGIELDPASIPAFHLWSPKLRTGFDTEYITSMSMLAEAKPAAADTPAGANPAPAVSNPAGTAELQTAAGNPASAEPAAASVARPLRSNGWPPNPAWALPVLFLSLFVVFLVIRFRRKNRSEKM